MISNKGFEESFITLNLDSGCTVGYPQKISANNKCANAADGDKLAGVLINSRNGIGSVQVKGYAKLDYTGTAPALGITGVSANGTGGIKADASGRIVTVLAVDTTAKTAEIIM